jgi:hypothetical protein
LSDITYKNLGREKSGNRTPSCIDIALLKTIMRSRAEKTHKVKRVQFDVRTCYPLEVDSP